ncbi:MAG TPA: hypothetical protein GXX23_10635 [Firmicutes bacterium]|nr:hypothetical protein [Candidatus Fermentithermobacillaceae bacterium]
MSTSIVTWVGALVTIGAFSYLFKENVMYRTIEHIYVGAAAGYVISVGYQNLLTKAWRPLVNEGHWLVIIPVLLGLMLFGPYFGSKLSWTRRYPLSLIIGVGAGITIRSAVIEQLTKQLASTALPLKTINNVLIVAGVLATLSYFFFTFKPTRTLTGVSEVGKWVIMITFGAAFGNAIMGRVSLVIGRVSFLFGEWIHLIKQ